MDEAGDWLAGRSSRDRLAVSHNMGNQLGSYSPYSLDLHNQTRRIRIINYSLIVH